MKTNLDGFHVNEVTLYTTEDIKPGMAVTIGENCTAKIPPSGTRFMGICTDVRGNYVSVALTGAVTVPYTGSDFAAGFNTISPDGNGYLKLNFDGEVEYLVLDVNAAEKLMTIFLK